MSNPLKASLEEILAGMKKIDAQFGEKITELQQKGADEKEVAHLRKGAMAMKDAGGIYLAWSNHYIEQLNKAEGLSQEDDEGGAFIEG